MRNMSGILILGMTVLLAGSAVSSNTASMRVVIIVEPIAVFAVTQGGVSTGDNKSYVTHNNGVTTIVGDGLAWTVNMPNVRITAHSDGVLGDGLSVRAVNVIGGRSGGNVTLRDSEQDVVIDITPGIGSCSLEYTVTGSPSGTETVTYTIASTQ